MKGNVRAVVCDLGCSKQDEALNLTTVGTPSYLAPEIWNHQTYDFKVDVWSLGVIFYQLLFQNLTPFSGKRSDEIYQRMECGEYIIPAGVKVSYEGLQFLEMCLQYNPEQRASWNTIRDLPYIKYDDLVLTYLQSYAASLVLSSKRQN